MAAELVVSSLPGEIRAASITEDSLSDVLVLREGSAVEAGDLFLARVKRFDKGLDGAFVDLGLDRDGLLPRKEMARDMFGGEVPPEGTALAVKVLRVPAEDKGARVSAKGVDNDTAGLKAPARLASGPGALAALIARTQPARIVCDDAALLKQLKALAGDGCETALHSAAAPLFEAAGLEQEIEALLLPRAALPGGGFLLIEPGETRRLLIRSLELRRTKREERPQRKHGNIPL